MKLKIGKMSNAELAEWFGINAKTLANNKAKKLEELKDFAKFDTYRGGVIIQEIIIEEYDKQLHSSYNKVKENIDKTWAKDGLDSCSRVGQRIESQLDLSLSSRTIYNYTRKGRNELYGIPFQGGGTLGTCEYLWCKKIDTENGIVYSRLSAEEEKIKKDLMHKYFGDTTEKQLFIKEMVEVGEISREDAWDALERITNMDKDNVFLDFLKELQEKLKCQIIRGTQVERYEGAFLAQPDDTPY